MTLKTALDIVDRDVSFRPAMSVLDAASEIVFGKSIEKQDFEDSLAGFFEARASTHLNYRGKLGATHISAVLDTVDGAMWTGPLYMGRFTPIDVVFDTGSDWLVVEDE